MASSEQDEHRRSVFREYVRSIDPRRFVFVDECSTNISLSPIYARAPKGERAHGKAPRNWGKNISLISAIGADGVKPSMTTEGAVDGLAFETYLEHFLLPALKAGQIVVMDQPLGTQKHKSKRADRTEGSCTAVSATLLA
jgi:DDE superfamily endonuclease